MLRSLFLFVLFSPWTIAKFAITPIGKFREGLGDNTNIDSPGRKLQATQAPSGYSAQTLDVPVDHFQTSSRYEPHSNATFKLRYFFDSQYYRDGGPIIVLAAGETDATKRIRFLKTGIINQLVRATHGIGVILEHRYYGNSFPVPDLSIPNMRFLSTEQAMADTAYFAKNVQFPGHKTGERSLNAPYTPWIMYGGSYAGAFSAFLRVTYPDIFWGAIGSSAVTQAIWDYWYYYEPIRKYGPSNCIETTQNLTRAIDGILNSDDNSAKNALKDGFGLSEMQYDDDFVNTLTLGISSWQQLNWDPSESDPEFFNYCNNITSPKLLYDPPNAKSTIASHLPAAFSFGEVTPEALLNYMGYIRSSVPPIAIAAGESVASYFGNHDRAFYTETSISKGSWRSWPWQYCTEYGFMQTGSSVPLAQLPLVSRLITPTYTSIICRWAFSLTSSANLTEVNKYGGSNISYPRLAFVDGSHDPWIGATPHAPATRNRTNNLRAPFILIEGGVHHWDENGLGDRLVAGLPPPEVKSAQISLVRAVSYWMAQWNETASANATGKHPSEVTFSSLNSGGFQGQNSPGGATAFDTGHTLPAHDADDALTSGGGLPAGYSTAGKRGLRALRNGSPPKGTAEDDREVEEKHWWSF